MEITRSWREQKVMLKRRFAMLSNSDFEFEADKKENMLDKLAKKLKKTRVEGIQLHLATTLLIPKGPSAQVILRLSGDPQVNPYSLGKIAQLSESWESLCAGGNEWLSVMLSLSKHRHCIR